MVGQRCRELASDGRACGYCGPPWLGVGRKRLVPELVSSELSSGGFLLACVGTLCTQRITGTLVGERED